MVGIRKVALNLNRAGLDVDLPIHIVKLTRILVGAPVGKDHFELGAFVSARVLVNLIGEVKVVLLADWEFDLDRIELGDGRQQRGRADQVSDLRLRDPRDAIYRRSHLRPLFVELGGLDRRLRPTRTAAALARVVWVT